MKKTILFALLAMVLVGCKSEFSERDLVGSFWEINGIRYARFLVFGENNDMVLINESSLNSVTVLYINDRKKWSLNGREISIFLDYSAYELGGSWQRRFSSSNTLNGLISNDGNTITGSVTWTLLYGDVWRIEDERIIRYPIGSTFTHDFTMIRVIN